MTTKHVQPRPGDSELETPPSGVIISIMGLIKGHWSTCIVEDNRPTEDAKVGSVDLLVDGKVVASASH